MRTKLSWGESDKGNVIGLVEALLALAEGKLELDDSELKTAVQVKWESACKLRVTGKIKQTKGKREQTVEVGTTKKDLVKLVEKFGKSLEFPKRQKGAGRSKEEKEADVIQNVIDYLKALGVLEEDAKNTRKNQGFWQFTLTLESEFATREDNLRWIKQKWNEHTQQDSLSQTTSKSPTEEGINWRDVCGKVLAQQQEKQNFRRSITGRHLGHEAKNVYVKLGLVKPKQQPRRGDEFQPSADRGMLQYQLTEKEIEQEYQYDEFLEQVIAGKEKNLTIVGEPGAGKSTWLEQIALYVDNSNKGFPICISLASLGGKTLEEYLFQIWLKNALGISQCDVGITSAQKKLEELFQSGKVWLLLDGVDEMRADESPLQAIATQLEGWGDLARVVLTCRTNVWEANPNVLLNFETYRTLYFDDEQVRDFIQQWFTQEGKPELGEELKTKLDDTRNERIRDLIKNPLRLAMLCGIWYFYQGDLPKTKATLYQQYIEYFYRWKQYPQLTDDLDKQEELHEAFSKLALEAIDKKLPLRKKFAHKVMGKSLFQLARDVGWLNWIYKDAETGEDVYAFFHLTFQKYFAACAIDDWHFFLNHDNENPNPLLNPNPSLEYDNGKPSYRIFELRWKEVILLWLGRQDIASEQKEEFIWALGRFEDGCEDFYRNRTICLIGSGSAEFGDYKWADEMVSLLVTEVFGYFDTEEQRWQRCANCMQEAFMAALRETDRNLVIAALSELLDCNLLDREALCDVAVYLLRISPGNPKAINALSNLLDSSSPYQFAGLDFEPIDLPREKAAFWLLENNPDLNNSKAIKILLKRHYMSWDTWERLQANDTNALSKLLEVSRLQYTLEEERNYWEYYLKVTKRGNPDEITTIIQQLKTTPNPNHRDISKLGLIGLDNLDAINYFMELARSNQNNNENENFYWNVLTTLGRIGANNSDVINYLLMLPNNGRELERFWAITAIRQSLHGKLLPRIVKGLKRYLQEPFEDNISERLSSFCYEIIWRCAERLPYPDFYQAWHQPTIQ
jgi:hypothetical protein